MRSIEEGQRHPLVIKWCLYLHHCSSKAYKVLRNSKCLHLPSERTLQYYTHFNTTGAGFSAATDNQLRQHARLSATPDYKNIVGLLFDEMHIKEGLFFNKNTDKLIDFVDFEMLIMTSCITQIQRRIVRAACLWLSLYCLSWSEA